MADEKVKLVDIIVPDVFEQYVIERTAELTDFASSGIIENDPEFDALAAGPSRQVDMPFWKDLKNDATNTRQILSDTNKIETRKIMTGQDIAAIHNDANSWSANVLSKWLSGSDPMGAIIQLVAGYWAREDEKMLISSLKGVFAAFDAVTDDPNLLKIAQESIAGQNEASKLTGLTFIDACLKLGDRADRLTAIGMHSDTEAALRKRDLIDFIPDSEGKSLIRTFQGRRVIVDDSMERRQGTTDGFVYTSVLFGPGAIAKGNAALSTPLQGGFGTEGVELARDALGSDSLLINRRRFLLHPRGVAFDRAASPAIVGVSPTNTELEAAAHWSMVYEAKNVRIVGIVHNN